MTQTDFAPYRAFWRKLAEARPTPEMRVAMDAARKEAEQLAQILASEFGVERVYLFGSFAWGAVVRPDSDIDLAAEGLAGSKLIFADVRLSEASKYQVDLVRLERAPTSLRELILKSGVLVYDRKSKRSPGKSDPKRDR